MGERDSTKTTEEAESKKTEGGGLSSGRGEEVDYKLVDPGSSMMEKMTAKEEPWTIVASSQEMETVRETDLLSIKVISKFRFEIVCEEGETTWVGRMVTGAKVFHQTTGGDCNL